MRRLTKTTKWVFLSMFLGVASPTSAEEPLELVRGCTERILDILSDPELKNQPELRKQRIWDSAAPCFDFEEITKRALAFHWRGLTPKQRSEFVDLFSHLLHRSYVDKLDDYSGETVQYLEAQINNSRAMVSTQVVGEGLEVQIDYRMLKQTSGWRIYDVVVEGVSLVNNYRKQFDRIIMSSGYKELVNRLRTKWDELLKESELGKQGPS